MSEEQNMLYNDIIKIVKNLKMHDSVECICVTPFIDNTVELKIIIKTRSVDDELNKKILKYNNLYAINSNDYKIRLLFDYSCYYNNMFDRNNDDDSIMIYLYNTTILYDKSGKYKKMQNTINKIMIKNNIEKNTNIPFDCFIKKTKS